MQTPSNRVDPPMTGSERELLESFLDYHRATLLWKIDGLSEADLKRSMTPSGVSLLGLVKHLAYVERSWFQAVFARDDATFPWTNEDPDADWRVQDDENADSIEAFYRAETERSRQIVAAASLDDLARGQYRTGDHAAGDSLYTASLDDLARGQYREPVSLRWIMIHMIEETARHNGHADLMRQSIDGAAGE